MTSKAKPTADVIQDEGHSGKYFHYMLNMADDDLDPYQYRLLGHYRRVCGLRGACWESIETSANTCKMSVGKASKTRQWLADNGWIRITPRKNNGFTVRLVDRMSDNVNRYKPSPHEGKPSPGEAKNQPDKNNQERNKESCLRQRKPRRKKSATVSETPATPVEQVGQVPPSEKKEEAADILKAIRYALRFGDDTGDGRVWQYAHLLRGTVAKAGAFHDAQLKPERAMTPDEIRAFGIWLRDTNGELSPLRKPETVVDYVGRFRQSGLYKTCMKRAETMRRLESEPPPPPPPPEPTEDELIDYSAEIDDMISMIANSIGSRGKR